MESLAVYVENIIVFGFRLRRRSNRRLGSRSSRRLRGWSSRRFGSRSSGRLESRSSSGLGSWGGSGLRRRSSSGLGRRSSGGLGSRGGRRFRSRSSRRFRSRSNRRLGSRSSCGLKCQIGRNGCGFQSSTGNNNRTGCGGIGAAHWQKEQGGKNQYRNEDDLELCLQKTPQQILPFADRKDQNDGCQQEITAGTGEENCSKQEKERCQQPQNDLA